MAGSEKMALCSRQSAEKYAALDAVCVWGAVMSASSVNN